MTLSPPLTPLTPGMRVLCRDAEWLVTQIHSANHRHDQQVVYCVGTDDLNRGHEAACCSPSCTR